jgi:outer membrane protein assembly factor BamD (BamD/ComL family)
MYNKGLLLYEIADAADGTGQSRTKAEQAWEAALDALSRFTKTWPKSLYAGDAYVKQVDIALERMFDLESAATVANAGIEWVKSPQDRDRIEGGTEYMIWHELEAPFGSNLHQDRGYEICIRAALIAYLDDRASDARGALALSQTMIVASSNAEIAHAAIQILQRRIASNDPITARDVLAEAKTDAESLVVRLGDLYIEALKPEKAASLYRRVRTQIPPFDSVTPGIEAYCIMQEASALMRMEGQYREAEALEVLKEIYQPKYAKYRWTSDGILWLGAFTYNHTQDWHAALPHFEYLVKHCPDAEETPRALVYCCLIAIHEKDNKQALDCYELFVHRYPTNEWRFAADDLKRKIDEMEAN